MIRCRARRAVVSGLALLLATLLPAVEARAEDRYFTLASTT